VDDSQASAAFEALVRAHYPRLYNYAYRLLGTRQAAEDAVQEVFLKVWDRRAGPPLLDPLAYLYLAVRHQCLMVLRRARRWREVDIDDEAVVAPLDPEAGDATDLASAAARAVNDLPERCRLIFTMSREQDLSYSEIARILGISPKTVENQIARALKILRHRLANFLGVAAAVLSASESWRTLSR
jgi:RNA polymerase sigma-70 factor (ECF subfamily)